MRVIFTLLVFVVSFSITAQSGSKINPALRAHLAKLEKRGANPITQLMVKGDHEKMKALAGSLGGVSRKSAAGWNIVSVKADRVTALADSKHVESIYYSMGKGMPLNDSMRAMNNVDSVHSGQWPLIQAYDGQDVVMGFIDTGLDPSHPDFKNADNSSRVLYFWNQNLGQAANTPQPYDYGRMWNQSGINNNLIVNSSYSDHGSHVTGIGAGNGASAEEYKGVAPKSDIIFVAYYTGEDISFEQTVADAVEFILSKADSMGKPCVINTSLGTYWGSHDGTDPASLIIDDLLKAQSGRALVAASGNSQNQDSYHLGYEVSSDTSFTWFKTTPLDLGAGVYPTVYFELWGDTAEMNQISFCTGADKVDPAYAGPSGSGAWLRINDQPVGASIYDDITNENGDVLGSIEYWIDVMQGDKYQMYVVIYGPDSSDYNFRFSTTGAGRFDVWSGDFMGISPMVATGSSEIPPVAQFAEFNHYKSPDYHQTMVSGWPCLESVITVGNYVSRNSYTDFNGNTQTFPEIPGEMFETSSQGPTRDGRIKPDVAAPGTYVLSCGIVSNLISNQTGFPDYLSQDGLHKRNTGTSMAAPGVAGIAALYLQKCPNAGVDEIRSAIIGTARQDTQTGNNLPDNAWGHGKADAFAALNSMPHPALSTANTPQLCGTDQLIEVTNSYAAYEWSSGDTDETLTVNSNGYYSVTVTDVSGCTNRSDSLEVLFLPLDSAVAVSACADYTWNGNTYNTSGTYTDTLLGLGGCDSIVTLQLKLGNFENLQMNAQATGSTEALLTWSVSESCENVDEVIVRYRIFGSSSWNYQTLLPYNDSTVIAGLSPSSIYEWKVQFKYQGVQNLLSPLATFQTQCGSQPPAAIQLSATNINYESATLNWIAADCPVDKAVIRYRPVGGSWSFKTVDPYTNSQIIQGLLTNTAYEWRVLLQDNGNSAPLSALSGFVTSGCAADSAIQVTPLSGQAISQHKAVVKWGVNACNVDGAKVRFRVKGNPTWKFAEVTGEADSVILTGLTPGARYEWRVAAYNATATSPLSPTNEFCSGPAAAQNMLATPFIGDNETISATLSWSEADSICPIQSAVIRYRKVGDAQWSFFPVDPFLPNPVLTGLASDVEYVWRVMLIGDYDLSAMSAPDTFSTGNLTQKGPLVSAGGLTTNPIVANLFPNPSQDEVQLAIHSGTERAADIEVIDLHGRCLVKIGSQRLKKGENLISIDLRSLSSGVYFVQITTGDQIETIKLMKQ